MENLSSLATRVKTWRNVLIASHRSPDGDAVGSTVGLATALRSAGYRVDAVNADALTGFPDPLSPNARATGLALIPGANTITNWEEVDGRDYDGALILDCGDLERLHATPDLPRRVLARCREVLVIDHHPVATNADGTRFSGGNAPLGVLRAIDPTRASCSELVAQFIDTIEIPMTSDVATALLTGLYTDTGGFLFENTDSRVLAIAADLRARGGVVGPASDILREHSAGYLRLIGWVLRRAVYVSGGKAIVVSVPLQLLLQSGADSTEVGHLTDLLSGTRNAYAIAVIREKSGEIRGSLRTRAPLDASQIAREWNGGGHARTAGFRMPGKRLAEASNLVCARLQEAVSTFPL